MNITESELKNHLDQYLQMAETAPVIVEKPGKIRLALISYSFYEHLKKLDDTNPVRNIFSHGLLHPADFTKEVIDEAMIRDEKKKKALAAVGRFSSGCTDVSVNHDAYLTDAF